MEPPSNDDYITGFRRARQRDLPFDFFRLEPPPKATLYVLAVSPLSTMTVTREPCSVADCEGSTSSPRPRALPPPP